MATVWKEEFCQEIILPLDRRTGWSEWDNSWGQSIHFLLSIFMVKLQKSNGIFNRCLAACTDEDWPWQLPWKVGSRQAVYGLWHGSGCRRAEGPWSSSYVPPCGLDPGVGPATAAPRAEPSASVGGISARRGQADIGEPWGPEPTQKKEQFMLNSTLVAKRANSISLRVSNLGYCGGLQYDDWARGKQEILFLRIGDCSLDERKDLFCWKVLSTSLSDRHRSVAPLGRVRIVGQSVWFF